MINESDSRKEVIRSILKQRSTHEKEMSIPKQTRFSDAVGKPRNDHSTTPRFKLSTQVLYIVLFQTLSDLEAKKNPENELIEAEIVRLAEMLHTRPKLEWFGPNPSIKAVKSALANNISGISKQLKAASKSEVSCDSFEEFYHSMEDLMDQSQVSYQHHIIFTELFILIRLAKKLNQVKLLMQQSVSIRLLLRVYGLCIPDAEVNSNELLQHIKSKERKLSNLLIKSKVFEDFYSFSPFSTSLYVLSARLDIEIFSILQNGLKANELTPVFMARLVELGMHYGHQSIIWDRPFQIIIQQFWSQLACIPSHFTKNCKDSKAMMELEVPSIGNNLKTVYFIELCKTDRLMRIKIQKKNKSEAPELEINACCYASNEQLKVIIDGFQINPKCPPVNSDTALAQIKQLSKKDRGYLRDILCREFRSQNNEPPTMNYKKGFCLCFPVVKSIGKSRSIQYEYRFESTSFGPECHLDDSLGSSASSQLGGTFEPLPIHDFFKEYFDRFQTADSGDAGVMVLDLVSNLRGKSNTMAREEHRPLNNWVHRNTRISARNCMAVGISAENEGVNHSSIRLVLCLLAVHEVQLLPLLSFLSSSQASLLQDISITDFVFPIAKNKAVSLKSLKLNGADKDAPLNSQFYFEEKVCQARISGKVQPQDDLITPSSSSKVDTSNPDSDNSCEKVGIGKGSNGKSTESTKVPLRTVDGLRRFHTTSPEVSKEIEYEDLKPSVFVGNLETSPKAKKKLDLH
jgi:hypothetical protein